MENSGSKGITICNGNPEHDPDSGNDINDGMTRSNAASHSPSATSPTISTKHFDAGE